MAGRPKAGLDYAGWSVNIFDGDTKIDKLLDAQGWIGFSIYFFLCQMAYKFDGYFYRWCFDDSSTTARRMGGGLRAKSVEETVRYCLQIGLFDQRLFDEWNILTSKGIQRRFLSAIQGRRVKSVIADYWLLEDEESNGLEKCASNIKNSASNIYLQGANSHLQGANDPKSKVKESKGKERKDKERKDTEANASCAEPEPVSTPPVITLPLNDGSEYPVTVEQCHEWAGLYPAVDVIQQLRNMRGWLDSNPSRRKTKRGINRFITSWLAKEQDRGGQRKPQGVARTSGGNIFMDMLREEKDCE